MHRIKPPSLIFLLLIFTACTRHYTPEPNRNFEPISEFKSDQTVTLLNGQPSTAEVKITGDRPGGIAANYHAWTDVAIQIASREMRKRGMTIADGAQRSITMSIETADYDVGMVELKTRVTMRVETSGGYANVYTGENASFMVAGPGHLIDGAMMRVVREMLLDARIVAFLTN